MFEKGLLSTNGEKWYPFTFFGIEFSIGSFSFYYYWFKKDLLKENTGYVSLNHWDTINIITFTKTILNMKQMAPLLV